MNVRRNSGASHRSTRIAAAVATACLASGAAMQAAAFPVDTNIEDLTVRFDNTVRYNLGTRVDSIDSRIGGNPLYDEGDYKFRKGQIVTDRVDLLTEFEADWRKTYGIRVSTAAWYDNAYSDEKVFQNPALSGLQSSYDNNHYSGLVDRYYKKGAEFLDAFVYANLQLGDTPLNLKAGRHVVYWGTALFSQGGISYSQQPIDGRKGAANPGTETRELFLPLNQISMQSQLTPDISVAAQYYLGWDHVRAPEGGTYYGGADITLDGPNRTGAGLPLVREGDLDPRDKAGNWGVNAKWTVPALDGTSFGLYYRSFDEKNGLWLLTDPNSPISYRAVFPRATKLIGLSADTNLGPFGIGAEISTRRNAGLNTDPFARSTEGARGDTWHALVNVLYVLPSTPLAPTGNLAAELTFDHLDKVTRNANLFLGVGTPDCPDGKYSQNGCATRNAAGFNVLLSPQYPQVYPGYDLTVPLTFGGGFYGNTADFGGTNQKSYSYSAGLQLDIQHRWNVGLTWVDSTAKIIPATGGGYTGNSGWQTTDRGAITLTIKTTI